VSEPLASAVAWAAFLLARYRAMRSAGVIGLSPSSGRPPLLGLPSTMIGGFVTSGLVGFVTGVGFVTLVGFVTVSIEGFVTRTRLKIV